MEPWNGYETLLGVVVMLSLTSGLWVAVSMWEDRKNDKRIKAIVKSMARQREMMKKKDQQ